MHITEFDIKGPKIIEPQVFVDERGFFTERFQVERFKKFGIEEHFMQDNFSRSDYGVLRGLHLQHTPAQTKLVTCMRGTIQDVIVDLRKNSPTYGQHISIQLDDKKPLWLYVPKGFAHGFCVLSKEGADVMYKVDAPYNAKGEIGIHWNDPSLNIKWSIQEPKLSPKDKQNLSLSDAIQVLVK